MAKVAPLEHAEFEELSKPTTANSPRCSKVVPRADVAGVQTVETDTRARSPMHQKVRNIRHTWYNSELAGRTQRVFRGRVFQVVTMVCLFIALFFADLWQICQIPTSLELDVLLTVIFAIFALEFFVLALTDTGYLLGFFFWTDLLGSISMVFDISYMAGEDATQPNVISRRGSSSGGEIVLVRAARASRLGARAGRISRVLKLLRYTNFIMNSAEEDDNHQVKMAKVISNQIANALSTRVAFLTIAVVVVIPLFGMLSYPEADDSMAAWTEMLQRNAVAFRAAWAEQNLTSVELAREILISEVRHFSDFYSGLGYGPFKMLYGETIGDTFVPQSEILDVQGPWTFTEPRRQASISIFSQDMIQVFFNLSAPKRQEAGAAMGVIGFTILVMCVFALVMSGSITSIALKPLERMLDVVRERCADIFKFTREFEATDADATGPDAGQDEHHSEFMLLEKVVAKLAAIVHLSTNQEPEVKEEMDENEFMMLNWMQGAQVPSMAYRGTMFAGHRGTHGAVMVNSTLTPSLIAEIETENLCTLDMPKETKLAIAHYLVTSTEGCSAWVNTNVKEKTLMTFINTIESKYFANPFHNFAHAVDVAYTVYRYVGLIEADNFLSDSTIFWLLIAAIGHDVGHIGVNNQYLVETSHELALRYNDHSPLENMHCAKLFQVASDSEANIFAQLERDCHKEMRKGMISAILHTDVTKHNEMIREMNLFYQMNTEAFVGMTPCYAVGQSAVNVQLVANCLLHGADVGNPMKPWELCKRVANCILDEFFAQGDKEKAAGIPVQMLNDRDKVNRPNSQIGFIEFVILPMTVAMVNLFPQLDSLASHLGQNIQHWSDTWQEEHSPCADAAAKVKIRVQKVVATCEGLMRRGDHASESVLPG